jgi:hypothetical protein
MAERKVARDAVSRKAMLQPARAVSWAARHRRAGQHLNVLDQQEGVNVLEQNTEAARSLKDLLGCGELALRGRGFSATSRTRHYEARWLT